MGTCWVCRPPAQVDDEEAMEHLRLLHPDEWGEGPQRWPDGLVVVHDETLEPGDFSGPA
jgi:hypothetical protein